MRASFRFYAELNDFLPPGRRFRTVERTFDGPVSVKDLIEAEGVPHTEVDLVVADGESVDFSHHVRDGARIAVYPVFEGFDLGPVVRVRPEPLRVPRFIADVHLGTLARHLRLLGFDTVYDPALHDPELAERSSAEHRILLTRDAGLLKRRIVSHGCYVRSRTPRTQLIDLVRRLQLGPRIRPFTRCLACNAPLRVVAKDAVGRLVPPKAWRGHEDFLQCAGCGRVYWRGTHYARLCELVQAVRDAVSGHDPSGDGATAAPGDAHQ